MSYFVSEVMALDKDGVVSQFWKTLFRDAKPGAIFVFDDNGHTEFTNYFDEIWKAAGLECLASVDNSRMTPRSSEESAELKVYKKKFDHHPKLASQLSYRILRKPKK